MSIEFQTPTRPLAIFAIALVSAYVIRTVKHYATNRLPPGPKGLPLVGNLFQITTTPWKQFELWKNQYGPLMYITAAGKGILVLNTNQVTADLLDRRQHTYSDRPPFVLASEIFTRGNLITFLGYGDRLRRFRRAGHAAFTKTRVTDFLPIQLKEALTMIDGILRSPSGWEGEYRRVGASVVLSIVYDLPSVLSTENSLVAKINRFTDLAVDYGNTGNHIVEFLTWMKYLPSWMAKWKREAEEAYVEYSELFGGLFREVEDRVKQGDERPSFVGTLVREREHYRLSDFEASWLAGAMYAAGSESTSTTLTWFTLAMIAYPDKQKKCQEELDRVVGRSCIPTFADRDSLPYLRATVRELLRWRPVLPLGIQHCTTEDDWYQGYFIPKGTICLPNIWCMNRDKSIYGEDADDFNPDRFIDEKGQLKPAIAQTKDGHVAYGFGSRICLGRHLANNTLFISCATLLWATNIYPVSDAAGKPIIPDTLETVNAGLVVRPLSFDCVIRPRFPEVEAVVAQMAELAK